MTFSSEHSSVGVGKQQNYIPLHGYMFPVNYFYLFILSLFSHFILPFL